MPLSSGDHLGPYEILEPLGKGGMGEVYRARDSRVGRDVAIKTSLEQFGERFEREARAIAALNHPNICTLFDVGPSYLVMELVSGPTLADRIAEGPIPVDEALLIARQIADALEAAHEQGIIHRNLKPANVKVRPDGTVKVLDFGLAKAINPEATGIVSGGLSMSPTITTPAMTQAGVILGTAAYMSPEQARGKAVDKRADVWAFGCVLYEMLTGQRAFEDEDVSLTLSKVLRVDPAFDALPAAVPVRVTQALKVCLQKDLRRRASDIHDVRLALDGAFETFAAEAAMVYVRPYPKVSDTRWKVSDTNGGADPFWAPDQTALYYIEMNTANGARQMRVPIQTGATFTRGPLTPLFPWVPLPERIGDRRDLMPDGRSFLAVVDATAVSTTAEYQPQIVTVHNWFEELKRLVPTP
jgi:serine/threonine protein kinase